MTKFLATFSDGQQIKRTSNRSYAAAWRVRYFVKAGAVILGRVEPVARTADLAGFARDAGLAKKQVAAQTNRVLKNPQFYEDRVEAEVVEAVRV